MNVLKREKRVLVVAMLAEGSSVRAVQRVTQVHPVTILRLLNEVGDHCQQLMDEHLQNLQCDALELDEAWTFVHKKESRRRPGDPGTCGDQYVYVAQDQVSKVIPCFRLGRRTHETTAAFLADLRGRVAGTPQLNTDGFAAYRTLVPHFFGRGIHFVQIIKSFAADLAEFRRYAPPKVTGVQRVTVQGSPRVDWSTTSHVEAQNVGLRTHVRRLSRLTLCFSKKWENLLAALRLHFATFNFVRRHNSVGMAPALAARIIKKSWTMADLVP